MVSIVLSQKCAIKLQGKLTRIVKESYQRYGELLHDRNRREDMDMISLSSLQGRYRLWNWEWRI
jgi:hypothetical protein